MKKRQEKHFSCVFACLDLAILSVRELKMQEEERIKQNTRRFVDKSCRAKRRVCRKWRINKPILWIANAYSIGNLPKWYCEAIAPMVKQWQCVKFRGACLL